MLAVVAGTLQRGTLEALVAVAGEDAVAACVVMAPQSGRTAVVVVVAAAAAVAVVGHLSFSLQTYETAFGRIS